MEPGHDNRPQERRRKQKTLPTNPLLRGVVVFCEQYPQKITVVRADNLDDEDHKMAKQPMVMSTLDTTVGGRSNLISPRSHELLISDLPKRYTAYPPLLLLPFNFATHSPPWAEIYSALDAANKAELFRCIAEEGFRKKGISRIAINAPIAAEVEDVHGDRAEETEPRQVSSNRDQSYKHRHQNVLRSPSGLVPVYGDWGPHLDLEQHRSCILCPTAQDVELAFWTSTSQHEGIMQVWAPLYTMFSRGNISEKGRILGLQSLFHGLTRDELGNQDDVGQVDVVDFYVGIGYFAFCYLKRGVRRVYGWDLNPWSIEGLRRGGERNGWRCEVVRIDEDGKVEGEGGVKGLAERIRRGDEDGQEERVVRCVAFLGDNRWAAKVMEEIQVEFERMGGDAWVKPREMNVRHANLGLLPTSKGSWSNAIKILTGLGKRARGGWLHIHENTDTRKIGDMAEEIAKDVDGLVGGVSAGRRFDVSCAYVEQVKTYAPGVMHCVYDIEIKSND